MKEVLTFAVLSILIMMGAYNSEYSWFMPVAIGITGLLFVGTCLELILKYHVPKPTEKGK